MSIFHWRALLLVGALASAASVAAKEAAPMAADPAVEAKVMEIGKELRCLVCQNQTIAESDAELAQDLRREVRDMVKQGMGRDEVVQFMEERYGDFVRYRPAFKATTALLWLGPGLLFVAALGTLYFTLLRRRKTVDETHPLSEQERRRVAALLEGRDEAGEQKT